VKRRALLTHGLVALAAIMAAHYFLFYWYPYLVPPSFQPSPGCSPVAATFLGGGGGGKRIRMEKAACFPDWGDIALYLDDSGEKSSRPFLILDGQVPAVRAAWTSPDSISFDIVGDDVSIKYARDRVGGVRMDYTMRPSPAVR
jgi:hypothetical protein